MPKKLLSIISATLIGLGAFGTSFSSETLNPQVESGFYKLEKIWLQEQSRSERKKSNQEVFSAYLPPELIPNALLSIPLDAKIQRQVAYDALKSFSKKVALEKSKPKQVPYGKGGYLIIDQFDGTKSLLEMISDPEQYLKSLPEPERNDFQYSEFARLESLPIEKTEFFQLRFGRLIPWEINYGSPTLADKLILHTLSEFYANMVIPGEEACRKKTKKNAITAMSHRELLTVEEKVDYLQALNSCRIK